MEQQREQPGHSSAKWRAALSVLVCGTCVLTSVFSKLVYQVPGRDAEGRSQYFLKPCFLTAVGCVALSVALPVRALLLLPCARRWLTTTAPHVCKEERDAIVEELLGPEDKDSEGCTSEVEEPDTDSAACTAITAVVCIVVSGVLSNIALIWLPLSSYQLLMCSELIFFAACLPAKELKSQHQQAGLALTMVGAAVAIITILCSEEVVHATLSVSCALTSRVLVGVHKRITANSSTISTQPCVSTSRAAMHQQLSRSGWEGASGSLLMLLAVLPAAQMAHSWTGKEAFEDTRASLSILAHSPALDCLLAAFFAATAASSVSMGLLEGLDSTPYQPLHPPVIALLAWMVQLGLHYGGTNYGQPWTTSSIGQAAALLVILLGALVFEGSLLELPRRLQTRASHEEGERGYRAPLLARPMPSSEASAGPGMQVVMQKHSNPAVKAAPRTTHHHSARSSIDFSQIPPEMMTGESLAPLLPEAQAPGAGLMPRVQSAALPLLQTPHLRNSLQLSRAASEPLRPGQVHGPPLMLTTQQREFFDMRCSTSAMRLYHELERSNR